jgi:hypothetical protein
LVTKDAVKRCQAKGKTRIWQGDFYVPGQSQIDRGKSWRNAPSLSLKTTGLWPRAGLVP